jgi:hypothetical protein
MNVLATSSTIAIAALREASEQAAAAQDALLQRVSELEENNSRLKDSLDDAKTEIKLLSQDQELLKKELELEISSNKRLQQDIKEFENLDEEFRRLENILGNLQEKTEQCEDLEKQIEASKSNEVQFEQSKGTIERLNKHISELEVELKASESTEKQLRQHKAAMEELSQQVSELKVKLQGSKSAEEQFEQSKATINNLKQEIARLERQSEFEEPLVQKAVALRRRFMIQARGKVSRDGAEQVAAEYGKHGNFAVHGGDGLADEALLLAGFLDNEQWGKVFESLYGKKPGEFGACPQGLRRIRDCDVTLKVVQCVRGARPSFKARSEAEGKIRAIVDRYSKDGEGAERCAITQSSIAKVEELTEEIVVSARGGPLAPLWPLEET